jgi:acetyltransferase-like isoleucine patch superfamily enzyme
MYRNIGAGSDIAPDLKVSPDVTLVLGDYVSIGPGVRIIGEGTVKFGDYSKIHGGCFISVPHPHSIVQFGCNTWIGERSVLDGRGRLIASHNVGVGIGSHLYTHIAHGDVMAGCKFMSEKPLNIGMDAWFVGQCLVSPVEVGERHAREHDLCRCSRKRHD